MKSKDLSELGFPNSVACLAGTSIQAAIKGGTKKSDIKPILKKLADNPHEFIDDTHFNELAIELIRLRDQVPEFTPRATPAPYQQWGTDIEEGAIQQMNNSCQLPVSVRGALMPDAHQGYGLPIGGVLAVKNAVIPFAVGVDIACRMKLTVYDWSPIILGQEKDRFRKVLENETRFGMGSEFKTPREHSVMDEDWSITKLTREFRDRAWKQLGTSGSGNHFVEFGAVTIDNDELGLEHGKNLALLSHSGSRGVGANVASFHSKVATKMHQELPDELKNLAWLDLDSWEGQQYWLAMELMGKYASANHDCIHRHIAKALGAKIILTIENHHNFAWKEEYDGETVIVHRKGATPAGVGVLGVIPGSMATQAYIVRGKGSLASLNSASHGAGRRMSRTMAKQKFTWCEAKRFIAERGVELLSAGLDECPMAYKDIEQVMAAQTDLVEPLARFDPKLVKMSEDGRAED